MTYEKKILRIDDITSYESMYESPFSLKISEMCNEIAKAINNDTETAVMRSIADIGINVDKEELIKALQYDRDQYNKGYSDGARFGFEAGKPKWTPVSEELPEDGTYLVTRRFYSNGYETVIRSFDNDLYSVDSFVFVDKKGLCGWYGCDSEYGYYEDTDVVAWMPLPEPYKPQESEDDEE